MSKKLRYRYLKKKNTLYLWDESLNIGQVLNKVWDKAYLEHYPDGGQDIDWAPSNWCIEYCGGEAILPWVKIRKEASVSFFEKVKKYIAFNSHRKNNYSLY